MNVVFERKITRGSFLFIVLFIAKAILSHKLGARYNKKVSQLRENHKSETIFVNTAPAIPGADFTNRLKSVLGLKSNTK